MLLVILDTTRADHLSSYGYARETTPHLDRLASEGDRYENAWAQAPWTLPAIATILTGQPPHRHGAGRGARGMYGLDPAVTTLAERVSAEGWRTAAFISVVWCNPQLSNLNRGFETYDFRTTNESNVGQRTAGEATVAAQHWLKSVADDPFLLAVHYFDPHLSYDPPPPYDTMFEPDAEGPRVPSSFGSAREVFGVRDGSTPVTGRLRESLIARYDGELRYADEQFGKLRESLEQAGRWDDTLVIVVADHGEEFWDHGGFEHGHTHFDEMLRVPLIVKRPGEQTARVVSDRVRQLDIAPTILGFAGLAPGDDMPGTPLGVGHAGYAVAEGSLWGGDLVSVRSDAGTLIVERRSGNGSYFDAESPGEERSLADAPAELVDVLKALPPLRDPAAPEVKPTPEQLEQLRSLGYVD